MLTWIYVACFGVPAVPASVYLLQHGELPTFMDLFPMYGGPWDVIDDGAFVALLMAFLLVTLAAAWAAWLAWTGSWAGAALGLALLPVEAVFWWGLRAAVSVAVRCGPWHPFCPCLEIPEAAPAQGSHRMISHPNCPVIPLHLTFCRAASSCV